MRFRMQKPLPYTLLSTSALLIRLDDSLHAKVNVDTVFGTVNKADNALENIQGPESSVMPDLH